MKKHWLYLKYVVRHKWFVFLACLEYGLIWRGIKHDWTKLLPREWFPYADFFYGDSRVKEAYVNGIEPSELAFEIAWNHHQKQNDHHFQYWIRIGDDGTTLILPMPANARKEMIADWRGAGKALGKPNTWEWYEANKSKIQLHPDTRAWVERELRIQKRWHEDKKYISGLGF